MRTSHRSGDASIRSPDSTALGWLISTSPSRWAGHVGDCEIESAGWRAAGHRGKPLRYAGALHRDVPDAGGVARGPRGNLGTRPHAKLGPQAVEVGLDGTFGH